MKKDTENSPNTCTKKIDKRYKIYAFLRRGIPLAVHVTFIICMVVFLTETAPVVKGTAELENPLTNSQMSMMFVWSMLFVMYFTTVRKLK